MFQRLLNSYLHHLGRPSCFQIYGKGRFEADWRVISVYATHRRDITSRWPLWGGTCITWTSEIIAVGWDFAETLLREQAVEPASRQHFIEVTGGRIRDVGRRAAANAPSIATASEILAHECGHTWQALQLGPAYLPLGAAFTLFREGPHFWNRFENQASEAGQFGGIVQGSVCARLMNGLFYAAPRSAHRSSSS